MPRIKGSSVKDYEFDKRKLADENLEKPDVWEKSHELVLRVYRSINSFPSQEQYRLVDQLCCSAKRQLRLSKLLKAINTNKAFTRGEAYE